MLTEGYNDDTDKRKYFQQTCIPGFTVKIMKIFYYHLDVSFYSSLGFIQNPFPYVSICSITESVKGNESQYAKVSTIQTVQTCQILYKEEAQRRQNKHL